MGLCSGVRRLGVRWGCGRFVGGGLRRGWVEGGLGRFIEGSRGRLIRRSWGIVSCSIVFSVYGGAVSNFLIFPRDCCRKPGVLVRG